MGVDDLFDDVETSRDPLQESDPVAPPGPRDAAKQVGADVVRRWFRDLTYREVHAIVLGFGPIFAGLVLYATPAPPIVANAFLAFGVGIGLASTLAGPFVRSIGYVGTAIRWCIKEPHYVLLGQVAAVVAGAIVQIGMRLIDLAVQIGGSL